MVPPPSNNVRQLFKQQQTQRQQQNKVDHVFAKYDSQGKLGCVLCKLTVKNEQLWGPHLQSVKHKQLLAQLKAIKQQQQQKETARKRPAAEHDAGSSAPSGDAALLTKRARFEQLEKEMEQEEQERQQQQQDASEDDSEDSDDSDENMDEDNDESGLPADFFDTPTPKSTSATPTPAAAAGAASSNTSSSMKLGVHRDLPSGFFDDANEEARARQVDAPDVMEDQQLDEDYAAFKEMMVDTNEETDKMLENDEETILLDREVTLAQQQLALDQKVQYLKQLRQQPHLLQTKQQQQSSRMDDHGDADAWTTGLKSSVREWKCVSEM
ncbi:hypothetical protein BCR42DRAFT_491962 [Absidia repens]|uniref:Zinc finger protein 830 n=1 Tax=Absidia repens TaxID=90262 RepID=A0A1X2IGM9_9FUNG|nr:hypothetical protein BCR42DRAFT_491962 [Absidia repens]